MKLDLDTITRKLADWKEKTLFVFVLLLAIYIARNATPMGGGVDRIDSEARTAAIVAAEVEEGTAMRALERLQDPPDISPSQIEPAAVLSLFNDERHGFKRAGARGSSWMLGQESFERLPPLPLNVPGIYPLADFDLPAGATPALPLARGLVPRDERRVVLTTTDTSEFKD